jgi:acyl-CoA synthetase (NDP forming)
MHNSEEANDIQSLEDVTALMMDYQSASKLLEKYGIKAVESRYVSSAEEAVKFAAGTPIALKGMTNKALHKTKSGLIAINLKDEKEIKREFNRISRAASKFKPYRILAQHMVAGGIEIIVGGNTDQQFGKMVLLGLGGVYVETFKDVSLRACPITQYDAISMLDQLKSSHIIAPDEKQRKMISELLLKVSRMFEGNDMQELDLNPLILHDGTYDAVDIRILK